MAAERDERGALVREMTRVKAALDDLAALKPARKKSAATVPPAVTFTPPPPKFVAAPTASVSAALFGHDDEDCLAETEVSDTGRSSADLLRMQFGIGTEVQETLQSQADAHDTLSNDYPFSGDFHLTPDAHNGYSDGSPE